MEMLTPAAPMPCSARPTRRTLKADVGAPVQTAEPIIIMKIADWRTIWRPKRSVNWAQKKRKAAEVRLKTEIIQFSWLTWSMGWLVGS